MKNLKKSVFIFLVIVLVSGFCLPASAAEIRPFSETGKIISVAHGGNWAEFPLNSYEAVSSAYEIGADCVSLPVQVTKDYVFVISKYDDLGKIYSTYEGTSISQSEYVTIQNIYLPNNSGNLTNCTLCTLADAIEVTKRYDRTLIIDIPWEYKNEIYSFLVDYNALENVVIRTDASKKEVENFITLTDGKIEVIGAYHGNLIFAAKSYVSSLSDNGCKAVMLSATNPFGVIFNRSMLSSFSANNYSTRAMMATYDPDLCGQRTDTPDTWDDIINRGYSIIETNQIKDLVEYLDDIQQTQAELKTYLNIIDNLSPALNSTKSASDIQQAKEKIQNALTTLSSFETLLKTKHEITLAFENLSLEDEHYEKRGVLKITAGKIIAVLLVSTAIIGTQVYFYKKRDEKKKENI